MFAALIFSAIALLASGSPAPQRCAVTAFAPAGTYAPARLNGKPGLVLSGGGLGSMPRDPALTFIRAHVRAPRGTRAGNLVILKASGGRDYSDGFYMHSRLASVREILIPPCATAAQVDRAAPYVDKADAVLFSGGDQAHYVAWKRSKLIRAVKRLYARGGVEGGGSAGLAIQGAVVYDSVAADRLLPADETVHTADAVKNPYEPAISFTDDMFAWPPLRQIITDTHFARRDRFGRLAAFMARNERRRGGPIYGLGIDEGAMLLVNERGIATLYQPAKTPSGYTPKGAWLLTGGRAARIAPGRPLLYTLSVRHLTHAGERFDLPAKQGGRLYSVRVDGSKTPVYAPSNPYGQ